MSVNFPKEFTQHLAKPNLKGAFFSMPEPGGHHPRDCKNCGGVGVMYLFLATGGPFNNPPQGKGIIAKWANGKWWAGTNEGGICPDCKGTGVTPGFVEPPASMRAITMPKMVTREKVEVEAEDYTDV